MKVNKFRVISILLSTIFFANYSLPIKAENILENIEKTGLLKVGIRSDAVPFGYRKRNQELAGICFDLVSLIRDELQSKLKRNIITVEVLISRLYNRFSIVEDNLVYLECGTNTIREVPEYNITFSDPFFTTTTQLLTKNDTAITIKNNPSLKDLKIGVLRYTTTEKLMQNNYPDTQLQLFQGIRGNMRAIQAVEKGLIDGFADDGILLIGESLLLGIPLNQNYTLLSLDSSCQQYGLILPKNDPLWQDFINNVIKLSKDKEIIKDWFSPLSSNLKKAQQICEN